MTFRVGLILPYLAFAASSVKAMMPQDKMFPPLECNADGFSDCVSWKAQNYDLSNQVDIPCGQCITMDFGDEEVLSLSGGLNVIGKLVIDSPVQIETPKVIVQGELHINSDKIWDGTQDITITLTTTGEQSFVPADSNGSKCGGLCMAGKKPFAVAGGRLLVNGMPSSDYETPTWLHIQDVKAAAGSGAVVEPIEAYPGLVELPECPLDGDFIIENFSSPSQTDPGFYKVESSLGSRFEYTGTALKVSERKDKSQGPIFDLVDVMHCVKPGVRYQLNARVKTYKDEVGPDTIEDSDCGQDGNGCLDLKFNWRPDGSWQRSAYPYHEEWIHDWKNGEEIFISETIVFTDEMVDPNNIYNVFAFEGLSPGVAIEVYQFEFKLAPEAAYRTSSDICPDLALPNGDAELDPMSPFPYQSTDWYSNVYVAQDEDNLSNHFFRISARGGSWHNSLRWDTGLGCITDNAVYKLNVDYRLFSHTENTKPEEVGFRVRLKVKRADSNDSWYEMARCDGLDADSVGTWQTCEKIYTVPEGLVKAGDIQYEIIFETGPHIDYDVDNISIKQSTGPINTVTVDDSIDGKWGIGAEVLITSHTSDDKGEQVRQIADIKPSEESGYVDLVLNATISAPTTMKDDSKYATEIAILSRNIRVQGADDDPDPLHGGHLIILHTPGGGQSIVGLEVNNMGQAGNLGRYPFHFHMCGDVTGSKVAKNLIRATNQRCTVVHGTDHLLIDNNVAYDTFGHCYMTEDGMERFNTFQNNLGARTKRATQVIPDIPDKFNGKETDDHAATFWITNPDNKYINNVAAGGEFSGYWFELRSRPRGTMHEMYKGQEWSLREMKLGRFKGNVAHSYNSAGIRTYPSGYVPSEQALFEDSRAYRNSDSGMFIHNSRNIALSGFHFADNEQGIDLDRVDQFEMSDSEIVGRSEDYKNKVLSQKARNVCGGWEPKYVRGVEMHTFKANRHLISQVQGAFTNVRFSRFNDTGCDDSAVFWADDEDRYKTWDYWTNLENSQVEGVELGQIANFCRAVAKGIPDSYITDSDSAFGAALGVSGGGVSTIMTYTNTLKKLQSFVEPTLCTDYPENCFSYCENTCLRTVTVRVDPTVSPDYKLKICKKDDTSKCETYDNWLNTGDLDDRYRIFSPALPEGSYSAEFVDEFGDVSWPRGVNVTYEHDTCNGGGLIEDSVEFAPLDVDPNQCQNLITNGGAEASNSDPLGWTYERRMKVEIAPGQGIGSSNAFADITSQSHDDGLTQHLDTRCFNQNTGRQYEVRAYVKLMDTNGHPVYCDPSVKGNSNCPRIILHHGFYRDNFGRRRGREIEAGITRARNSNDEGFQLVQGIVTVDDRLTDASNVRLFVERRANNMEMLVDNVSMTLVSDSSCAAGEDLVLNGDFETGSSENWNDRDAEGFKIVTPGVGGTGYALKMTTGSAQQRINSDCVEAGKRYMVQAKYRLLDWDGNPTNCNPTTNNPRCPEMSLNAYNGKSHVEYAGGIARAMDSAADTDDGYSTLWGIYQPSSKVATAEKLYLFFVQTGPHIIVDDISFTELGGLDEKDGPDDDVASACGDIVVNGDTEFGIAGFWSGNGLGNDKLSTTTGYGGTGNAVRVTGRSHHWHGMWYSGEKYMSKETCLIPGSKWKVSAQIRLLGQNSDSGIDCDALERVDHEKRCPRLRVRFYNEGDPYTPIREEILYEYTSEWNKDGWNEFGAQVEIPSIHGNVINKVAIVVAEALPGADIAVDNLSMTSL